MFLFIIEDVIRVHSFSFLPRDEQPSIRRESTGQDWSRLSAQRMKQLHRPGWAAHEKQAKRWRRMFLSGDMDAKQKQIGDSGKDVKVRLRLKILEKLLKKYQKQGKFHSFQIGKNNVFSINNKTGQTFFGYSKLGQGSATFDTKDSHLVQFLTNQNPARTTKSHLIFF